MKRLSANHNSYKITSMPVLLDLSPFNVWQKEFSSLDSGVYMSAAKEYPEGLLNYGFEGVETRPCWTFFENSKPFQTSVKDPAGDAVRTVIAKNTIWSTVDDHTTGIERSSHLVTLTCADRIVTVKIENENYNDTFLTLLINIFAFPGHSLLYTSNYNLGLLASGLQGGDGRRQPVYFVPENRILGYNCN